MRVRDLVCWFEWQGRAQSLLDGRCWQGGREGGFFFRFHAAVSRVSWQDCLLPEW